MLAIFAFATIRSVKSEHWEKPFRRMEISFQKSRTERGRTPNGCGSDFARKKLPMRKQQHELLPFLALWAVQYQKDHGLDGIHPTHYDLMVKYGARMDSFKRATNTQWPQESRDA